MIQHGGDEAQKRKEQVFNVHEACKHLKNGENTLGTE
jgi:hypothetical protein